MRCPAVCTRGSDGASAARRQPIARGRQVAEGETLGQIREDGLQLGVETGRRLFLTRLLDQLRDVRR